MNRGSEAQEDPLAGVAADQSGQRLVAKVVAARRGQQVIVASLFTTKVSSWR